MKQIPRQTSATVHPLRFIITLLALAITLHGALPIRVRAEHIHEALRHYAGIAEDALAKKFPLGVTDKERLRAFWG